MHWCCWCADATEVLMFLMHCCCLYVDTADVRMLLRRWCTDALMLVIIWCCWHSDAAGFSPFLAVSYCFSLFLTVSHRFSPFFTVSHLFSPFLIVSCCFSPFLNIFHSFSLFLPVFHHESICCWPCWSGGCCGVLTDKSPTWRGLTCPGGLVFHGFPGTSSRPHYMPVKRAECFTFRDFFY